MSNQILYSTELAAGKETMDTEESGSAYEVSSEDEPTSPDGFARKTAEKTNLKLGYSSVPRSKGSRQSSMSIKTEDAVEWAATFQAPSSPGHVKTPPRRAARVHPVVRRKNLKQSPNKVRAKRLKSFYNDEYRLLLNDAIHDASTGMLEEDQDPLEGSQVGSSLWTPYEKAILFSALARLGRDDLRGISIRIGTKSESEVHDYVLLLHQGMRERQIKGAKLLQSVELPAALEISDECCAVLERAGDAITARQELAAKKVENKKWGDSSLLTKDEARWFERRIRQKGGQDEVEEVFPAVNLLNLHNWLELSRDVFMNPGLDHREDNWESIAEPGETPAIRATAFEDFHSLTVSFTARLISTTLFCTMSRLKARDANIVKHAEVRPADVDAAVKILGLKSDSNQFWINCARRCHLTIVNDESDEDEEEEEFSTSTNEEADFMTYDAVESSLKETTRRSRSRSRSTSRAPPGSALTEPFDFLGSSPEYETSEYETSESDIYTSADEEPPPDSSERSDASEPSFREISRPEGPQDLESSQDAYAEAIDIHASRTEEVRLWSMLRQAAPFEIDIPSIEYLDPPRPVPIDIERREWRNHIDYWSQWETLTTPVPERAFEHNQTRLSRKGKRKAATTFSGTDGEDDFDDSARKKNKVVGDQTAREQLSDGLRSDGEMFEVESVEDDAIHYDAVREARFDDEAPEDTDVGQNVVEKEGEISEDGPFSKAYTGNKAVGYMVEEESP
jgi:RNA polymerase I-specific transcription initiation factor RRN5